MSESREGSLGVVVAVVIGVLVLLMVLVGAAGLFMYQRASTQQERALHEAMVAREQAERTRAEAVAAQSGSWAEATEPAAADASAVPLRSMTVGRETLVAVGGNWLYLLRAGGGQNTAVELVVLGLDCQAPELQRDRLSYSVDGEPQPLDPTGSNLRVAGRHGLANFDVESVLLQGLAGRLVEGETDIPGLVLELTGFEQVDQVWDTVGR